MAKNDNNQNKVNMNMLIRRFKIVTIKTDGMQPPSISNIVYFFLAKYKLNVFTGPQHKSLIM